MKRNTPLITLLTGAALGVVLLVARLLSALGLGRSLAGTPPRQAGAALTLAVTIVASVVILEGALSGSY